MMVMLVNSDVEHEEDGAREKTAMLMAMVTSIVCMLVMMAFTSNYDDDNPESGNVGTEDIIDGGNAMTNSLAAILWFRNPSNRWSRPDLLSRVFHDLNQSKNCKTHES